MRDPRIPLKSPLVAGLLAFLIPGAGHWYQGRRFKATIFSVGILTLFVWGMILGNWQPVYSQLVYQGAHTQSAQLEFSQPRLKFSFGYAAQFLVGAPALPSLVQELRFRNATGTRDRLDSEIDSDFSGIIREHGDNGEVARRVLGQMTIRPAESDQTFEGTLTVTGDDGTVVEYALDDSIDLGRAVFGSPRREIRCDVIDRADGGSRTGASLQGTIHRKFLNWFQAPRDTHELDQLHGDLNRRFDIASVFTWIAGLLNLLAIWDAAAGPAYAYGDEKSDKDDDDDEKM